ncbi:phenoloxidase-activating factor 2 isoform X1 [Bombus vancouverensis nearcticus]|uniref:Phenoloxidase-activating factor 2 n=1 Tax=Bombus bifarius TaxID=103933 RepID=A0A6P8ND65_9HYME|nr:phenoloxidase-activating factor 2-like isoform X1 [Bombus vancouverensis nearcticus]XP_033319108.1 phenoloxidase-activating factor 2-like isoform X1 [Bombus bifarius]
MWRILLTLAVSSFSLVVSAPQKDGGLDSLIASLSGTNSSTQTPMTDNELNALISNVFTQPINQPISTTAATILGTDNKTKQPQEDCTCVTYYLCRNGTISDDGETIIDIRSGFNDETRYVGASWGKCADYMEVCCKPPDRTNEIITPPPIERKGCGQRHPNGVGFRITGAVDNEAQFGEFPWMVAILKEEMIGNEKVNLYQCGGSLIHKLAVLTAAHCVQGKQPSELKIRAGEWDTQTKDEIYPHQDRKVEKVIVHENYKAGTLFNDFAILILSEPVNLVDNVDLVCLPERNAVFDNSRCFASGWGRDIFGKEGHYQVILKKVELPIVPRKECQDKLRETRLGKYFRLHETFICAGGEAGKDTCKGDGGGPLVCPMKSNPGTYLQAGIVAWGIGCAEGGTPGVYANVASARDWIDEQMAFNNLDNTVYQPQA